MTGPWLAATVCGALAAGSVLLLPSAAKGRTAGPAGRRPAVAHVLARCGSSRRRRRREAAAFPVALESVARSLRSGATLPQALAEAAAAVGGQVGDDLARVAVHARSAGLGVALDAWSASRQTSEVRVASAAIALASETGGAAAAAIDGVASSIRQRQAAAGEVRALSTQARLSAIVIGSAPAAFALLSSSADRRASAFLLGTRAGWTCLAVGLGLDAAGVAWMTRITGGAT